MENHKIILSKEFISDYSKDNKNSYKKGTHQEPNELTRSEPEIDPEKFGSCSKFRDELSECIRNYYNNFLTEEQVDNENDRSKELLKCGTHFKEFESCLKGV